MKRTPLDSSSLASAGYDAATAVLEIEFREGGVYQYYEVPASVHQELMAAESHGTYFVRNIRPSYPYRRVG